MSDELAEVQAALDAARKAQTAAEARLAELRAREQRAKVDAPPAPGGEAAPSQSPPMPERFEQATQPAPADPRSKGVGIVFVTQSPKDAPSDVLAQLGSRVQHPLRAHTPDDASALRAAVRTYPKNGCDLEQVLTSRRTRSCRRSCATRRRRAGSSVRTRLPQRRRRGSCETPARAAAADPAASEATS